MLYITTDSNKIDINDADIYFDNIEDKKIFNNNIFKNIIKCIDGAEYNGYDKITTPYGETIIHSLSTGCKTVLLAVLLSKEKCIVNIVECGKNALEMIFNLSQKIDLYTYINHAFLLDDNNIQCTINGKLVKGNANIYYTLEEFANE